MAKHWFHGKASNAKRTYIKKHPKSIYARAKSAMASGYREQVVALRTQINALRARIADLDDDDHQASALMQQLRLMQRKLAQVKQNYA